MIFHADLRKPAKPRFHVKGSLKMYTNICKHCYKVFKSRRKTYTCSECRSKDEEDFDRIEAYLKEYPNSNALQISEALGITAYQVLTNLNEGRLNISRGHFERIKDDDI